MTIQPVRNYLTAAMSYRATVRVPGGLPTRFDAPQGWTAQQIHQWFRENWFQPATDGVTVTLTDEPGAEWVGPGGKSSNVSAVPHGPPVYSPMTPNEVFPQGSAGEVIAKLEEGGFRKPL